MIHLIIVGNLQLIADNQNSPRRLYYRFGVLGGLTDFDRLEGYVGVIV